MTINILYETSGFLFPEVAKFSARTSPCSHPSALWITSEGISDSREALATLFALDLVTPSTRNYFVVDNLRQHIAKMARNNHYSGEWLKVKVYLETIKSFRLNDSVTYILSIMSTRDYFGNFLRLVRKQIRKLRWRPLYSFVTEDHRSVVKKIRRRGYDDKGSRRPEHQRREGPERSERAVEVIILEPPSFQWFKMFEHLRS